MWNADQYCTVLNLKNVVSTSVNGITLWGATVEFIKDDGFFGTGTIYFLSKKEALNFETGDRFLK